MGSDTDPNVLFQLTLTLSLKDNGVSSRETFPVVRSVAVQPVEDDDEAWILNQGIQPLASVPRCAAGRLDRRSRARCGRRNSRLAGSRPGRY